MMIQGIEDVMITQWNKVVFLCALITFLPIQTHFLTRLVLFNPATGQYLEEWINVPTISSSTINPPQQRTDLINRTKRLEKHSILTVQDDKSEAEHLINTRSALPLHLLVDTPDNTLMDIVRNTLKDVIIDNIREKLSECSTRTPCSPLDYSYAYALLAKIFALNIGLDMDRKQPEDILTKLMDLFAPPLVDKLGKALVHSTPPHHFIFAADIQSCLILNTLLQIHGWEIADVNVPASLSVQQQADLKTFLTGIRPKSVEPTSVIPSTFDMSIYSHAVDVSAIPINPKMLWNPAINLEEEKRKEFNANLLAIVKKYGTMPQLVQSTSWPLPGWEGRKKAKDAIENFLGYLTDIAAQLPNLDQTLAQVRQGIAEKYQAIVIAGNLPSGFESKDATDLLEGLHNQLRKELDVPLEAVPSSSAVLSHEIFFGFIDKLVKDYKDLPKLVELTSLSERRARAKTAVANFLAFLGSMPRHTAPTVLKQEINRRYNAAVNEGNLPEGLESKKAQEEWEALTKDLIMLEIQAPVLNELKKLVKTYENLPKRVQSTRTIFGEVAGWERRAAAKKAVEDFLNALGEEVRRASLAENVDITALKETIVEQYKAAVAAGGLPGDLAVGRVEDHAYLDREKPIGHWNEFIKKLKECLYPEAPQKPTQPSVVEDVSDIGFGGGFIGF